VDESPFIRRFARGFERPSPDQMREWHVGQMFDSEGSPIDVEAGLIIQPFIENPTATISVMIIQRRTRLNPFLIGSYCRQMCSFSILEEDPPLSVRFTLAKGPYANMELIEKIRNACRGHMNSEF
jgi:hypothetical protein